MFIAKEDKATERRNHQAVDGERKVGRVALFFHCFFFYWLYSFKMSIKSYILLVKKGKIKNKAKNQCSLVFYRLQNHPHCVFILCTFPCGLSKPTSYSLQDFCLESETLHVQVQDRYFLSHPDLFQFLILVNKNSPLIIQGGNERVIFLLLPELI